MPRFAASLSIVAVSALLAGTALGATPEAQSSAATMSQSLENGVKDAQMKRSQGDFAGAVRVLSQLMMMAADDPRVVGEYGKVLVQQGRSREGLDFLNRAVQLQQGDWSLYSALGVAYDQAGDYSSARGAYEQALALKPGEPAVLNNYAMSRALAGDLVTAKKLIADASAESKDERVARNMKMINSLNPKVAAIAPALAARPATPNAAVVPRTLTPAEGRNVVMQAVPSDPKAGAVAKGKPRKAGTATAKQQPAANGIPALRLANDRQ